MTDLITAEEAEKLLDGPLLMELANEHRALLLQAIGTDDADAMAYSKDGKPIRRVREITSPAKQAAEVISGMARTVIALHAQLADAQAAQAMVVKNAASIVDGIADQNRDNAIQATNSDLRYAARTIRALAHIDGLALVQALRAERDALAERLENEMADLDAADRRNTRLAAANAALEAQVGARRAERDQLRAAVEGLIAVLDRNGEKGPIPDVEMMFCWLAAQNVRAAFRNTEGRGDMTDDEALETLFAMANVQDGYAKKATDPGLKVIHKANAKAQRKIAATIKDLRVRLAAAEAERDRLAAANDVLEAKVVGLVEALEDIASAQRFPSHGDPVVLRDRARAALATQEAGNA